MRRASCDDAQVVVHEPCFQLSEHVYAQAAEKQLRVQNQQLQLRSRQLEKEVEHMERQLGSVQNHAYTLAQPPRTQLSPGL